MNENQEFGILPFDQQPLVTFVLLAYNQEDWVRDAVQGALAQDYLNLEIILSDDASTDKTFDVIKQTVVDCATQRQLTINRNNINLGLCGHVNSIFERARGELIVLAAGDDISLPHRVSSLVNEWLKHGKQEAILHSNIEVVAKGSSIKTIKQPPIDRLTNLSIHSYVNDGLASPILGAAAAYTPGIYRSFGPLNAAGSIEDGPMVFRGLLIGAQFLHIEEPLVKYRITGTNISSPLTRKNSQRAKRFLKACQLSVRQHALDLEVSSVNSTHLQQKIDAQYHHLVDSENILSNNIFSISTGILSCTRGLSFADRAYFVVNLFDLNNNPIIKILRHSKRIIFQHLKGKK